MKLKKSYCFLLLLTFAISSCEKGIFITPKRKIEVSIASNESYQYSLLSIDTEEELNFLEEAMHSDTSQLITDSTKTYPLCYLYSPKSNFSGKDIVVFKINRSNPKDDFPKEEILEIKFTVN